jgi:hypothetical protein
MQKLITDIGADKAWEYTARKLKDKTLKTELNLWAQAVSNIAISVINVFRGFRPQQIVLVEIRLPPPTTPATSQVFRQSHSRIFMIEREIHLTFSITFKILSIILY